MYIILTEKNFLELYTIYIFSFNKINNNIILQIYKYKKKIIKDLIIQKLLEVINLFFNKIKILLLIRQIKFLII